MHINEEIENLPEELDAAIYIVHDKFKPSLMAGNMVFHFFDVDAKEQINRGFLVMDDNKEIYWYNGGYYQNDGELKIRGIMQKALGLRSCENYKREVIGWIKDHPDLIVNRDIFNNNPYRINLLNGTYDLKKECFEEHTQQDIFNYVLPVFYKENAKMPNIQNFLETTLSIKDIELIQKIVGYCLFRKYLYHIGVIEVGGGRNGKSTLNELITTFLGADNVSHIPLQRLCYDRFAIWNLYNKMANICSDLSPKAIEQTGTFKMLTGGDHIYAEKKHQDGFNFVNVAKLIFSCNIIPEITDKTKAMAERIIAIEFTNTFDKNNENTDRTLLQKLTTDKELSGFFNWAIEGLQLLLSEDGFSDFRTLEDVKNYQAEMQNPVRQFIDTFLERNTDGEILKSEVYNKFLEFCRSNAIPSIASNQFTQKFKQYAPWGIDEGQSRIKKGKTWKGVTWVQQQEVLL